MRLDNIRIAVPDKMPLADQKPKMMGPKRKKYLKIERPGPVAEMVAKHMSLTEPLTSRQIAEAGDIEMRTVQNALRRLHEYKYAKVVRTEGCTNYWLLIKPFIYEEARKAWAR